MSRQSTTQRQQQGAPTNAKAAGLLQRRCACGTHTVAGGECESCGEEKARASVQRSAVNAAPPGEAPPAVGEALRSAGRPLEPAARSFFESRLGHDFSGVRVHTDAKASESASAVNALAYTVGRDVVFRAGQYSPSTPDGRRLLAHELAHVVQQDGQRGAVQAARLDISTPGDAGEREADAAADAVMGGRTAPRLNAAPPAVRRKCGPTDLGAPAPDCAPSDAGVAGWPFLFKVNCDELLPGEEANTSKPKAGSKLRIHGFASAEGDAAFNMNLSCHRANKVADLMRASRPDCPVEAVLKHGASPQTGPGVPPDFNPPSFWRSVIVEEVKAQPREPQPKTKCGPDATDWLVKQVAAGKRNAKVLEIRQHLDNAAFFAPLITGSLGGTKSAGLNSTDIVEGAVLTKVNEARVAAGSPRPTPDANTQIGDAALFGLPSFQTAALAGLALDVNAITTLKELRSASLKWKALVGSGKPYDFKVDSSTMLDPKSANCPDSECGRSITLCAGSAGLNCYGKDLPGNVFYATIGRFVGFSENTLQLGSQFAQLASTKMWDPPEDTQMISFGFNLPGSLTSATFCSALQGAKSGFPLNKCGDCNEPAKAAIIDPK
ncbi:MAG TPA: DUF4157 domain-containing protein [Pyrinomonadaceae bacterium]|nr:DUF4157 domain-containing protein [Pyrinomonadaceae bacterium]